MEIALKVPDSLEHVLFEHQWENLKGFLQLFVNRVCVGGIRYGRPSSNKKFLDRLCMEVDAYDLGNNDYDAGGNFEHLLNIAVYCWLESEAPQHPRFHFDNKVGSVTR